jgi:hypothetical protein
MGAAVPNAETKKSDRGESKIANADPQLLAQFSTWNQMKQESSRLLKLKEQQLVRNFVNRVDMQAEMHQMICNAEAVLQVWKKFQSSC